MEEFSDKKTFVSEYNEAAYQISRLHNLWLLCNSLARIGKFDNWKWVLDRIWVELSPDAKLKDGDKRKDGNYFEEVEKLNKKIGEAKNRNSLYKALQEKEIFLRCLQENVGKGSKKSRQYEDFM